MYASMYNGAGKFFPAHTLTHFDNEHPIVPVSYMASRFA